MNITHISVSRYGCFTQCQQQYKFKYHLKVPSPVEEPFYFVYGKIIHKMAEEYVRAGGKRKLGDIATDVLTGKILLEQDRDGKQAKAPPLPADYRARMPEHLRAIQRLTEQIGFDGHLEWQFKYDLDPPNNRCILGFIDRLIQRGDLFWIIDYKTTKEGSYRKHAGTINGDLQLRTYAKVVQKFFGAKAENIRAALYYLEGAELVSTRFTQQQLDSTEGELLRMYKLIDSIDPDHAWGKVGPWCKRCDYVKMCPFYKVV